MPTQACTVVRLEPPRHRTVASNRIEAHSLAPSQRDLDDQIAALLAANPGIGAVLVDCAGHVKLFASPHGAADCAFARAPGAYPSIQAAIDAAVDGDSVYVAAGICRERLAGEHVSVRRLIIDGRQQGWVFRRSCEDVELTAVPTDDTDSRVDRLHSKEAVRLLDGSGQLRGSYARIQEAIDAAVEGDEVVIQAGLYAEDLRIEQPIALTRGDVDRVSERAGVKAIITGRVIVAASAMNVTLDGLALEGPLEMESIVGATASLTLRNCRIEDRRVTRAADPERSPTEHHPGAVAPTRRERAVPVPGP